ncbi:NADH:flavin oxidoreductase/NADH oxidase family protein [Nocardia asteroides NBRC 15531]|uniref:Oxidoreductase n=1 Tax=Nocardia asteroides NBRC 15531 TaxID=1110697 RepID=U5EAW1_NOCAS|nr:NADH:flavin oxidoreductase/NADH oxidase family protein [Nocardia asteroides]TLF69511.1 NADH:flavin oxidoreductase/NADH oxidase family protein [Nocardia asteroides NBRC 15531]UGT49015.1 NADH:flavin oxidoreductase/NADH oxidase family protein [Nocardia asteroides]SFL77627.1 2,4-dienoyl-CoA reductase [Nocardia asteroides]VEG31213.1 NADH oxidase [Nocardia asteroides]GAD83566.1 putative oxidoreductase [Nocardia asteroides NBRC 15531]
MSSTVLSSPVFTPFTLPNGAVLPNRLAKAAMEENMAAPGQLPDASLFRLYQRWSEGGVGLIITGNVMVHAQALTGPGGVVLDAESPLEPFREWAAAAKSGGSRVWMQINHPGRQVRADMPGVAWGPSAIRVDVGKNSKMFAEPDEMTAQQIMATVERFAVTARRAEEAGFDGVEVHAAHGYLLSQFLSPLANRRTDRWGGSLENRARLLLDIVAAVRAAVSPGFAVAVKLNSADFQRGGFDADDAATVIGLLAPLGVDVVELSGGSYEAPAMTGQAGDERSRSREAYFLTLAEELAATSPVPLMLTGGVVRRPVAEEVLAGGVELVGMGSALAVDPDLPNTWRRDPTARITLPPVTIADKAVASAASMARIRRQLRRLGAGRPTRPTINPKLALLQETLLQRRALRHYRTWLATRSS